MLKRKINFNYYTITLQEENLYNSELSWNVWVYRDLTANRVEMYCLYILMDLIFLKSGKCNINEIIIISSVTIIKLDTVIKCYTVWHEISSHASILLIFNFVGCDYKFFFKCSKRNQTKRTSCFFENNINIPKCVKSIESFYYILRNTH